MNALNVNDLIMHPLIIVMQTLYLLKVWNLHVWKHIKEHWLDPTAYYTTMSI